MSNWILYFCHILMTRSYFYFSYCFSFRLNYFLFIWEDTCFICYFSVLLLPFFSQFCDWFLFRKLIQKILDHHWIQLSNHVLLIILSWIISLDGLWILWKGTKIWITFLIFFMGLVIFSLCITLFLKPFYDLENFRAIILLKINLLKIFLDFHHNFFLSLAN